MLQEIENEAWRVPSPKTLEFCRVAETTSWTQIFSTGPLPDPKCRSMGTRFLTSIRQNLSWKASPPIRDGPGVAWAGSIVTSTKLSNRPIGPTAHSQRCENAGKTRLWNRA